MARGQVEKRYDIGAGRLGEDTHFAVAEAYKTIRTNLLFSLASSGKKTIVVSSPLNNDGKSTVCGNLAIALAQTSAKVMIIDGDLRKPSLHRFFRTDNKKGLSNLLVGFDSVADSVKRNVYKNLDLVTAGTLSPNPSELLVSKNMEIFLKKMEEYYDYILIDTAPVNVASDAVALCGHAAGILMVVKSKQTKIDDVRSAVSSVNSADANILGVVLNRASSKSKKYYGHYYGY